MEFQLAPDFAKDCVVIGNLNLCTLLLVDNSQYPWVLLVPRRAGIAESYQLEKDDQISLIMESNLIAKILKAEFQADKLNIAAIGNVVPQLHVHHVARFKSDPLWPSPVWGAGERIPYAPEKRQEIIELFQEKLKRYLKPAT